MSRLSRKHKSSIVKVARILSQEHIERGIVEASIHEFNKPSVRQFLSGPARKALGSDLCGYFEAERIGPVWFLDKRVDGEGWRW